jgi:hypothetical protein
VYIRWAVPAGARTALRARRLRYCLSPAVSHGLVLLPLLVGKAFQIAQGFDRMRRSRCAPALFQREVSPTALRPSSRSALSLYKLVVLLRLMNTYRPRYA